MGTGSHLCRTCPELVRKNVATRRPEKWRMGWHKISHVKMQGNLRSRNTGPSAGSKQLIMPLAKFHTRCKELADDSPILFLVGPRFASRAVSCLGYISQLATPPKDLTYKELHAAHKVLHIPVSMDVDMICSLKQ